MTEPDPVWDDAVVAKYVSDMAAFEAWWRRPCCGYDVYNLDKKTEAAGVWMAAVSGLWAEGAPARVDSERYRAEVERREQLSRQLTQEHHQRLADKEVL